MATSKVGQEVDGGSATKLNGRSWPFSPLSLCSRNVGFREYFM